MASLDKLAIRGIRSFDATEAAIIQFFSPLTLIVGHNGSGKTTIIECLRYATTGEQPPNTKGGAFIHDPKMSGNTETKAQVRLRFRSVDGHIMDCLRSIQVTAKKAGGLTLKTLESALTRQGHKGNKRTNISIKCLDLNAEMISLLGVSRAILDNVIFCHQEDSNWPLSEPAALKKKFDDIFDATKWTKALKNIQDLRKELMQANKVENALLTGLETDKQRAEKVERKRNERRVELSALEAQLDSIKERAREKTNSNMQYYDRAALHIAELTRASGIEDKINLYVENETALTRSISVLEESDNDLNARLAGFSDHLKGERTRERQLTEDIRAKDTVRKKAERDHRACLTELGSLEAQKKQHEDLIARRDERIAELANEFGIKGFATDSLVDSQVTDFRSRLDEEARKLKEANNKFRKESSAKETELTAKHQNLRGDMRAKVNGKETQADMLTRLRSRRRATQDEIEGHDMVDRDTTHAEKTVEEIKQKQARLEREFAAEKFDYRIKSARTEISVKESAREELTVKLNALNRDAENRAKLDLKRKELTDKEAQIQSLLNRNADSYRSVLGGGDPTAELMDEEVNGKVAAKEHEIMAAERDAAEKDKALNATETSISITNKQIAEKTVQANGIAALVEERIDSEKRRLEEEASTSLSDLIKVCEDEIRYCTGMAKNEELLGQILQTARDKQLCQSCNRSISDAEFDEVEKHMSKLFEKVKEADDGSEWLKTLEGLQALLPREMEMKSIRETVLPELEAKVEAEQPRLTAASAAAEKASGRLQELKEELRALQALKRASNEISRLSNEKATSQREVRGLEEDLAVTGSTQSPSDVQSEIAETSSALKKLQRDLTTIQTDRDQLRTKMSSAQRELHDAEMDLNRKRQEQAKRETLQKRLAEIVEEIEDGEKALTEFTAEIEALAAPIRQANDELQQFRTDTAAQEKVLADKANQYDRALRSLTELTQQIQSYTGPQKLADCQEQLEKLAAQMKALDKDIQSLNGEIKKVNDSINDAKRTEDNIRDNLRLRSLRKQISDLRRELDDMDLEVAQQAKLEFEEKYESMRDEEVRLSGEAASLTAKIAGVRSAIKDFDDELKNDYKDVHERYGKKYTNVKLTEMAVSDLDKHGKAIDAAVMKFHSHKMEEINRQISFLWTKTYQGTDVDTILIKSDHESVAKGGRSYNYRVCMVKNQVEMDMRGRCSAGQKVLASIIIRLALSDSFSSNCGILALDEPTTNLDAENIHALAGSLADLITERANGNFQLILITHDETFLERLSAIGALDQYWRVKRTGTSSSEIVRETIRG